MNWDIAEHSEDKDSGLPRRWSALYLALGIVCGLATHLLIDLNHQLAWQFGPSLGLLIGTLAFCLMLDPRRWLVGTVGAMGLALLLALLATNFIIRFAPETVAERRSFGTSFTTFSLIVEALIVAKISVPFLQTWQEQGHLTFPYRRLFAHAWNNGLIAALSATFAGLFWIIIWLFAKLFEFIGFDQLTHLIEEPAFAWPASTAAVALGIYAGRDYRRVVVALRRVVFTLFSLLSPLFLFLAFSFLVALSFGGFSKLATALSASGTLIALLIIGIVLFNALLRDGTAETGKLFSLCAALMPPALLGLSGYAAYAIYLRIDQYGLTPDRIWIAVTVAVLGLHALAYLAALAWLERWMTKCRQANIGIAGIVAITALALQTPWGDPYRLSAQNQYDRLASGLADPAKFDYGLLRFELGGAGAEMLERIRTDAGVADPRIVAQRLAVLAETNNIWEWQSIGSETTRRDVVREIISDPKRVERIPADLELPDDLTPYWLHSLISKCGPEKQPKCVLIAINLTDGRGEEFIFAAQHPVHGIAIHLMERAQEDQGWTSTYLPFTTEAPDLWEALHNGEIAAVPPLHYDLRIGDEVMQLRDTHRAPFAGEWSISVEQMESDKPEQ